MENKNPTVEEIVASFLQKNGYDGLFDDECGCKLGDLFPCKECSYDCSAGYLVEPSPNPGYDFIIVSNKPEVKP